MIYGSIFEGWRIFLSKFGTGSYSLYKLFTCFMCLGTWFGFAVSLLMNHYGFLDKTPLGSIGVDDVYLATFFNGLLSGGGVWLVNTFQEMMERMYLEA